MRVTINLIFLLTGLCLFQIKNVTAQDRIHIWIKAFIANHHPDIPNHVIALPGDRYIIQTPDSKCAMTDNRDFSSDPDASARATTDFVITIKDNNISILPWQRKPIQRTSFSRLVDCNSGIDIYPPMYPSTNNMQISKPTSKVLPGIGRIIQVEVDAYTSDPFYMFAPNLKYRGTFTYVNCAGHPFLTFHGAVTKYPAFESYVQLNDGPVNRVFVTQMSGTAFELADFGVPILEEINRKNISEIVALFKEDPPSDGKEVQILLKGTWHGMATGINKGVFNTYPIELKFYTEGDNGIAKGNVGQLIILDPNSTDPISIDVRSFFYNSHYRELALYSENSMVAIQDGKISVDGLALRGTLLIADNPERFSVVLKKD